MVSPFLSSLLESRLSCVLRWLLAVKMKMASGRNKTKKWWWNKYNKAFLNISWKASQKNVVARKIGFSGEGVIIDQWFLLLQLWNPFLHSLQGSASESLFPAQILKHASSGAICGSSYGTWFNCPLALPEIFRIALYFDQLSSNFLPSCSSSPGSGLCRSLNGSIGLPEISS